MASEDILGAHVLVGVTCIDEDENLVAQFQTHGVLTDAREDAFSYDERTAPRSAYLRLRSFSSRRPRASTRCRRRESSSKIPTMSCP